LKRNTSNPARRWNAVWASAVSDAQAIDADDRGRAYALFPAMAAEKAWKASAAAPSCSRHRIGRPRRTTNRSQCPEPEVRTNVLRALMRTSGSKGH